MLTDDLIKRINELARKSKAEGLTSEELEEQKVLRQEYIQKFKQGVINTISTIKIVDKDGEDVTPIKLKKLKEEQNPKFN
ncbi:MAG: hypothetical protein K0S51_756 [Bacillales bacterium]|jgi:uncharacterized protein YnzC (UPF0291/DUF896 family)|nr:hypothetical protein [Bacillales bacterium]